MLRPVGQTLLRERLDRLVATFDISTIEPDPLQLVLRWSDPLDQEVAGLIAADQHFLRYLQPNRLKALMEAREYLGTARERASLIVKQIRERVKEK